MNRILIVGHPQSGYEDVEKLLQACGMAPAKPSRREGLLPREVTATLSRGHGLLDAPSAATDGELRQMQAGPVWNGIALDLLLGNLDQPLWGWSDTDSIRWLDYWSALDPSLQFVLVYDRPHSILTRAAPPGGEPPLCADELAARARRWSEYNNALLHFFHRHRGRCALVHTEALKASVTGDSLSQLQTRLDVAWTGQLQAPADNSRRELTEGQAAAQAGAASPATLEARPEADTAAPDAATWLLADLLIRTQAECLGVYDELQASAHLPLDSETADGALEALPAWNAWKQARAREHASTELALRRELQLEEQDRRRVRELLEQQRLLAAAQQAREAAEREHAARAREHEAALRRIEAERGQALARAAEIEATFRRDTEATASEAGLMREQLHQLQEELEQLYLERQARNAPPSLAAPSPAPPPPPKLYGAGDRVRQHLNYRVGACMIRSSRSIGGWLAMPWAVMSEVCRFRDEAPARSARKLPPLSAYGDVHEADRVRQHLSYRLGETFLDNCRTPLGWLRMPRLLQREVAQFRLRRTNSAA